ncbi:hypothetical protein BROUX41_003319 [Berkeleyomyces rouxiae]
MVAFPPPLLHKCAAPVSSAEFAEVVQRLCTPRFPSLRPHSSRKIALAVSGGLDSMALAVLFSQFLKHYPRANIGDARVSGVEALIIDHSLRPGSLLEAKNVATEVQRLPGIRPVVASIDWTQYGHTNPEGSELDCSSTVEGKASSSISSASSAPNLETLARQARYQLLGKLCMKYGADSLFFAHHRSDVYETVLLRLLSGASRRGLSGIRSHGDIPECYGMFGVHRSGLAKALHDKQSYLTTNMLPADLSSVRHRLQFRRQLPRTSRCALDEALRACAPGNIRFTLPALYFDGTISVAQGEKVPMPHEDLSLDCVGTDEGVGVKRIKKMTILALPTLGYALPEASQQVEWQIFYKMVDNDIKAHADGVPKNQE